MVPQARHRIFLGQRLHGLALPLAALDVAALTFIKIDQFGDGSLLPFAVAIKGRILTIRCGTDDFLCAPPGLFDEAAVAAAERWRFAAGQAAVTTRQVMRFRLPAQGRSP